MKTRTVVSLLLLIMLMVGSTAMAEEPQYGGTLNFPLPYDGSVGTLDPAHSSRIQDRIVHRALFDCLLRFDAETLQHKPAIAESFEISDDGMVYTFNLRQGATFHNGREIVADDIKYTYERVMDPAEASLNSSLFINIAGARAFTDGNADEITGIEVVNDHKLIITLEELDIDFIYNLDHIGGGIVPREEVEKGQFANQPVGSGPFTFNRWVRGSEIIVDAYDDYYGGRPYLDQVAFKIMPEAPSREAAFRARELDFDVLQPAQLESFRRTPEFADQIEMVTELWTRAIYFNLELEKFQDVRVRQAFNYAIDTDLIIERLVMGKDEPAIGFLPPSSPGFNPNLEGYDFNPDKARELMEAAGYTPDNPLEIEIIGTSNPTWGIPIVEGIMPYLEAVGFDITPVLVDGATWSDMATSGNYEAYIMSRGGMLSPTTFMMRPFWSEVPRAGGNHSSYSNPDFDYWLEKAMETIDFDERLEYIWNAEKILVEDAPIWFYNYNRAVVITQPWVHGIIHNPMEMAYQDFEKIWIDETSPRR